MDKREALHSILLSMINRNAKWNQDEYRSYSYYYTKQISLNNRDLILGVRVMKTGLNILLDNYIFTLHIVGDSLKQEKLTYTFSKIADRRNIPFTKFDDDSYEEALSTLERIEGNISPDSNFNFLSEIESDLIRYATLLSDNVTKQKIKDI